MRNGEKFTALLHHLTIDLLRETSTASNAAAGVDQMTWKEYSEGVEDRLRNLHDRDIGERIERNRPGECPS